MIDQLNMIEDLKEIKNLFVENGGAAAMDKIDEKIAGYQKQVDEFEKWAEEESQKEPIQIEMPFPEGVR